MNKIKRMRNDGMTRRTGNPTRWVCLAVLSVAAISASAVRADNVAWRMIVLPDTQNYTRFDDDRAAIFNYMTQWMVDNKEAMKLSLVLGVGDIVEDPDRDIVWQRAKTAYSKLDGHLPYVFTTGNHDYTSLTHPRQTPLNDYFNASDNPLNDPAQGGILAGTLKSGHLENAYYEFTAPDGRELLITSLEWSPRDSTVDWANAIVGRPEYQNHTAILTTHAYLYYDGSRYDYEQYGPDQNWNIYRSASKTDPDGGNDGELLWQKLVKPNPNYELVFSGHVLGDQVDRLTSVNDAGGDVHQMLFNAQIDPNGGDGWMRILEFMDDGQTVNVRTFSPWLESLGQPAERFTDDHNFTVTLKPLAWIRGDLDSDGFVGINDLTLVLSNWNQSVTPDDALKADITQDNFVGIEDLNLILGNWNQRASTPGDTLVGDTNGDGFIGIEDLTAVLGNWNIHITNVDPRADPTGDGFVGIEDLNFVLANWNAGTPPADGAAVPEPATLLILGMGVPTILRRR
jgi:calcineurin-like phosphoesterase family protein